MSRLIPLGGLFVTPAVWSIGTELGLIVPYHDCATGSVWQTAASVILLLGGIATTLISLSKIPTNAISSFIARASFYGGLIFSFALALQLAASILVDPCLR